MILKHKLINVLGVALLVILLFLPMAVPFRVVLLAFAALFWTFIETGGLASIGLGRHRIATTLAWGFGLFIALTSISEAIGPVLEHALGSKPDYSGYGALVGNAKAAVQLILFAWVSAAIGEESLFRGFLLNQMSLILGPSRWARWTAIIVGGVIFGAAHHIQGPLGMVNTGIVGVVFGWSWFRSDRNLYALMIAHALTDTYGIGMLYFGRYA